MIVDQARTANAASGPPFRPELPTTLKGRCASLWASTPSLAVAVAGMALMAIPGPAIAGDAATGKSVFQSSCAICHSVQPGQNKIGPTLFGVVGRKTGSVTDYSYSAANQGANMIWDDATLDKYLQAPRAVIPGTKMAYAGVKDPAKRADVISYLDTLK